MMKLHTTRMNSSPLHTHTALLTAVSIDQLLYEPNLPAHDFDDCMDTWAVSSPDRLSAVQQVRWL